MAKYADKFMEKVEDGFGDHPWEEDISDSEETIPSTTDMVSVSGEVSRSFDSVEEEIEFYNEVLPSDPDEWEKALENPGLSPSEYNMELNAVNNPPEVHVLPNVRSLRSESKYKGSTNANHKQVLPPTLGPHAEEQENKVYGTPLQKMKLSLKSQEKVGPTGNTLMREEDFLENALAKDTSATTPHLNGHTNESYMSQEVVLDDNCKEERSDLESSAQVILSAISWSKLSDEEIRQEIEDSTLASTEKSTDFISFDTETREELVRELAPSSEEEFEITFERTTTDSVSVGSKDSTRSMKSGLFNSLSLWGVRKTEHPAGSDDSTMDLLSKGYAIEQSPSAASSKGRKFKKVGSFRSRIRDFKNNRSKQTFGKDSFGMKLQDGHSFEEEMVAVISSMNQSNSVKGTTSRTAKKYQHEETPKKELLIPTAVQCSPQKEAFETKASVSLLSPKLRKYYPSAQLDSREPKSTSQSTTNSNETMPKSWTKRASAKLENSRGNRVRLSRKHRLFRPRESEKRKEETKEDFRDVRERESDLLDQKRSIGFSMATALQGLNECESTSTISKIDTPSDDSKHGQVGRASKVSLIRRGKKLFEKRQSTESGVHSLKNGTGKKSSEKEDCPAEIDTIAADLFKAEARVHRRLHEDLMFLAEIERKKGQYLQSPSKKANSEAFIRKVETVIKKRIAQNNE